MKILNSPGGKRLYIHCKPLDVCVFLVGSTRTAVANVDWRAQQIFRSFRRNCRFQAAAVAVPDGVGDKREEWDPHVPSCERRWCRASIRKLHFLGS